MAANIDRRVFARDGSGGYSLPEAAFVYDSVISETAVNSNFSDIATALAASIAKDGQTNPTANLPMATYRHTGVGDASARTHYAAAGQVADGALTWCGTAGGTKNALTLSPTPAIAAYAAGQKFRFKAGATQSDDVVTIAVSGLTTKAGQINDAALSASLYIEANKYYEALYDGTAFQLTRVSANLGAASEGAAGLVELATDAETATGTDTARAVTPANIKSAYIKQGTHTVFIPAGAMRPTTSNGCAALSAVETTAGRPDLIGMAFDATADEHAQFQIAFPKGWNEGTVTFRVWWWSTAADTDGVAWGLQGVACSDGDTADVAYGTPVVVTDAAQSTTEDVYVTAISSAVTIDGTPAAGDICFFRLFRDVSDAADTAAEDCILLGVQILYTVNSADDS